MIKIEPGLLKNRELLLSAIRSKKAMIVTQENVAQHYLAPLRHALTGIACDVCFIPNGEAHKTLAQWERVLHALADQQHARDTTLIALGGGMVGDITGFAAATYMRGVNYIQIPTTLLAQVDAAIGGKTGVNLAQGKNLVGAFHAPTHTLIDTNTLNTLPDREYRSGFAEIIKAALIADPVFFEWLDENAHALLIKAPDPLKKAITTAANIKDSLVKQDEKENGIRALLNLGHTFAHAIEKETAYRVYLHGEAVAIGLVLSAILSCQLGRIPKSLVERISQLLHKYTLPTTLPKHIKYDRLLAHFTMDKKNRSQQWRFIVLNGIGDATIAEVDKNALTHELFKQAQAGHAADRGAYTSSLGSY